MSYGRPPGAMLADLAASKEYEQTIAAVLGEHVVDRTSSTDQLDFWVPGYYLDVKEKRQKLTARWLVDGLAEEDSFVLDELSLRKALEHYPAAYFVIRDVPAQRLFLAGCWEVACVERKRFNRVKKGKFVVDLRNFREVSADTIVGEIMADLANLVWRQPECVGAGTVPQV